MSREVIVEEIAHSKPFEIAGLSCQQGHKANIFTDEVSTHFTRMLFPTQACCANTEQASSANFH